MSGARVAGEVVGQRCELCSGSEETAGGSMQCIHSWLESLPMIALFECGEEVVAANDLARRFLGTDARVHLNQIFIGAYPMIKEQRRQRFECLFTPLAGATKLVTGVVQPCEAAGPEGRLVLLMEPLEDSVNDATFDGKGKSIYLEDLFDSASEAMVIVQRGRILRVNSEFERIFGYPSASCIGSSLRRRVGCLDRHHTSAPEGRANWSLDHLPRHPPGEADAGQTTAHGAARSADRAGQSCAVSGSIIADHGAVAAQARPQLRCHLSRS